MTPFRISRIDTAIVRLPFEQPVITPIHHITGIDNVLVTVETDQGLQGIAWLWCFGIGRARTLKSAIQTLEPLLLGRDPRETIRLSSLIAHDNNFMGRSGVVTIAQAALEVACWDIKARALDEPLWRLLGGARQPMRAYAGGLFLNDSIDSIVEEARRYVLRGFRAIKMRTGKPRLADDIERVEAIRSAIGPDVHLMVDVVQGWTADQAIRAGRALERFDLDWIEDPVAFDDHASLAKVAAALDIPICAGENDYGLTGFARLLQGRCIDIAMPDLQRVGGISEWLRVAALAQACSTLVTPHVFHEVSIHLASAVPNADWIEYVPWWDPLFIEPVPAVDGMIIAPDRPGLGLQFDWNRLDAMRME